MCAHSLPSLLSSSLPFPSLPFLFISFHIISYSVKQKMSDENVINATGLFDDVSMIYQPIDVPGPSGAGEGAEQPKVSSFEGKSLR